ncbi:MAG: LamG domain-containing protein [Candidatus Poribacteria bacterium]
MDYNAGSAAHLGAGTDPNEGNPPIVYLPFDEATGTITAYDRSGNGKNGTLVNMEAEDWVNGKYGNCLNFDGTNESVTLPAGTFNGLTVFSFTCWFYADGNQTGFSEIIQNDDTSDFFIRYNSDMGNFTYTLAISTAGTVTIPAPAANTWHFVGFTYDGTNTRAYLDGVLVGSSTASGTYSNATTPTYIANWSTSEGLKGKIDEVKIYNYARNAGQIAYDYNKGKPVAQYKFDEGGGTIAKNDYSSADSGAAPVGWWRMDEGSGTSANDLSGNGRTMSLAASPATPAWVSGKIGPNALQFDGTDDTAAVSSMPAMAAFSLEYWVKHNGTDGGNDRITSTSGDYFETAKSGDGSVSIYGGALGFGWVDTGYDLTAGSWTHLAFIFNGLAMNVYANGVLVKTQSASGSLSSANWRLGGRENTGGEYANVSLDDVRIYSYVRTAEQIYNDYKTTHGTLVGSNIKFVDGKIGKALSFSGSGDYVNPIDIDSWIRKVDYVTISGWYYHGADTSGAPWGIMTNTSPVGSANGFWWHIKYPGNVFYLRTRDSVHGESDGTGTPFVSVGSWYYITTVVGTNKFDVYVNGTLYWSWTPNASFSWSNINSDTAKFIIGYSYDTSTTINGKIDDVRIYNYNRTADQIMQDFNEGKSARLGAQATGTADPWGGAMPVGWWKLDENTGVLAQDASGNGNNGTLTNMEAGDWVQAKNGSGLSFDGTNEYVDCGTSSSLKITGDITIEAWVKLAASTFPDGTTNWTIVNSESYQNNGFIFRIDGATARPYYRTNQAGVSQDTTCAFALANNTLYHVALTRSGANATCYINGVKQSNASSGVHIDPVAATSSFKISYSSQAFNGFLDDVRVYNYVRTPAQIAWDYNKGKPVGYWRFDEASDVTCYDDSGNNNGTSTIGATGSQATIAAARANGATGKFGRCMSFDGSDDWVGLPNFSSHIANKNQLTYEAWFKTTGLTGTYQEIIEYGVSDFAMVLFYNSYSLRCIVNNVYKLSYTITPNTWYHAAIVLDVPNIKLFVNGVLVDSASDAVAATNTSSAMAIGARAGGSLFFKGQIDDVRIYNYARTVEQVTQDYNQGLAARLGD